MANIISQTGNTQIHAMDEDIERAAFALKAMSNPLRLKILCTIDDKELSVQDIVEQVGTTQSNVSQHLAKLKDKNILSAKRDANRIFYRINDDRLLKLINKMCELFCVK